MVVDTVREEQAIRQVTERLVENFGGTYSPEYIEGAVGAARRRFAGHPVRTFIPILVERYVRRQLEAAGEVADTAVEPDTARTRRARHKAESGDGLPAAVRETWSANKRFVPAAVAAAVAALVVVTVVTVALAVRQPSSAPQAAAPGVSALALVRGVVGSEKMSFFQDPKVAEVLARNGVKVEVDAAGSREIATSVDLGKYEFAFPSSEQAAERIQRQRNVSAKYIPFSSPMAIATFKPIADLLAKSGVVHQGPVPTFDMAPYLRMVGNNTRWDQLVTTPRIRWARTC